MASIVLQIACVVSASTALAQETSKSALIVHGDKDFPPYTSLVNGVPVGMDVDFWKEIAKVLGRPLDYRLYQWADAQARVTNGEGKILSLMSFNEERGEIYDFSLPTFSFKYSLFVPTDNVESINVKNLAGKRLAVKIGGFPSSIIESLHPRAEIVFTENSLEGFRKLLRREVDGVVEDELVGYTILDHHGFNSVSAAPIGLASSIGYIAITKENRHLVFQINSAINELKESGKFDQIADKWAGAETLFIKKKTLWLALAIASIVLVLFALIGGIIFLGNMRKARDQFEQQVKVRTLELEVAKQEAEQANLTKSRFLAYASHDLRQPLQSLNLLNATLIKSLSDSETQRKILEKQKKALDGMKNLLNSLLDITRLESGLVEPCFVDVPLQSLFDTVSAEFEDQAAAKGLILQIEPTDTIAFTDPDLTSQVIQNLTANAIRYTETGFVRLSCTREVGALRVALTDSGIGIPKKHLNNIFDEFLQLEREPHEGYGGLGLGLAIVQNLAGKLDIKIDVESQINEGSTFSFLLTMSKVKSIKPVPIIEFEKLVNPQTKTILLIDDNIDVLESSQDLFEFEGYTVSTATSPHQAYLKVESLTAAPDIIVTDLHLAHGDSGIDVIRSVRTRVGGYIPAILVTGDSSSLVDSLDIEQIEVMIKPVDPDQLIAAIHRLLTNTGAKV